MRDRVRRSDDGASLVLVLIIVTILSVVLGVVLDQADTNVRVSVALRNQTSNNYGADAAAQAVITQYRNGKFTCSSTTATPTTLGSGPGSPFYSPVATTQGPLNAAANCVPDSLTGVTPGTPGSSQIGPTNTPTDALLTVGQNYPTEDGIDVPGNWTMCVQNGSVQSYSSISGPIAAGVSSTGSTTACPDTPKPGVFVGAYGAPAPPTSGCLGTATQYSPTGCTQVPAGGIPSVDPPTLAITAANTDRAAICQHVSGNWYAALLPGLYNLLTSATLASLTTPCQSGANWITPDVLWLTPGTYYFDFGSTSWTVPFTVIGGTPTLPAGTAISGLDATSPATLTASSLQNLAQATAFPGACVNPGAQSANHGVELVFGGASSLTLPSTGSQNARMDICANYVDINTVPVAIYGANAPLPVGGATVSAESGCVATPGCIGNNSLIIPASPNGHESFHFEGYVWAPTAGIIMTYKNSAGQEFNWGVLVRTFQITGNGASPSGAFISLPKYSFGPTPSYSIHYINVWTCLASATSSTTSCPTSAAPNVRVKIQDTLNASGVVIATKVLSWSHLR